MAKPIYCTLLLVVLCIAYETHGNEHHRIIRHIRMPSHTVSNNDNQYDSSFSPTAAGADVTESESAEKTAPLFSSSPLRKSFSFNGPLGNDRNRRLGLNSQSLRRPSYYEHQPSDDIQSEILNGEKLRSMFSGIMNSGPLPGGMYNRNSQINMNSENPNMKKRQNSMTSDFQGFPNLRPMTNSPLARLLSGSRQNNSPSSNDDGQQINDGSQRINDDSQQINDNGQRINDDSQRINDDGQRVNDDGQRVNNDSKRINDDGQKINDDRQRINDGGQRTNDNSDENNDEVSTSTTSNKNSVFNPSNFQGHNMIVMSHNVCCINDNCRVLKNNEECNVGGSFPNMKTLQQPNNAMPMMHGNMDGGLHGLMSKLMESHFDKPFGQKSFSNIAVADSAKYNNVEEAENSTNMMKLDPMRFQTVMSPSDGFGNVMGQYNDVPQKKNPITYEAVDPIGFTKEEADKIRKQVLEKSNFYREKYNLEPFTLDDQLNNCAQDWANKIAKRIKSGHRPNNYYGENLYSNSLRDNLGINAVNSWYNEIMKFKVDGTESQLSSNIDTHHLTQLLWKPSTKLGVGVSKTLNGMNNIVANYDPSGNMIGKFKPNVPKITDTDIAEAAKLKELEPKPKPKWTYY